MSGTHMDLGLIIVPGVFDMFPVRSSMLVLTSLVSLGLLWSCGRSGSHIHLLGIVSTFDSHLGLFF